MSQDYTSKIIKNGSWATLSFIFASICNFAMSVAITRYFGKAIYGQYSYFLWLTGIIAVLAGFGFQQTLNKFLAKYFFTEPQAAAKIFQKLLRVQVAGSIIISFFCILGIQFFTHFINFENPEKSVLLAITFLSIIPVSLNTFLYQSFSAIQEFKKIAKITMFTSAANLILIVSFIITQQNLVSFLWLYFIFGLISSIILLTQTSALTKPGTTKNPLPYEQKSHPEKLFKYSLYAYISIICTQIVWERSEIFFLGAFSSPDQIAIYTLAYTLAILFIGLWGPLNAVLSAMFNEIVMTEKHDKLQLMTQHGTKYIAMTMLPLSLIASLFIGDIVELLYGESFRQVALLFPLLVISHVIAIIITPAGTIPMLKNEMKKSMFFNIATATLNIILDFYLITKYQAVGAMLANVVSQFFSIALCLINAKKYGLGIFNKYMLRIFAANTIIATIFYYSMNISFIQKIAVTLTTCAVYIYFLTRSAFNKQDIIIFKQILTRPNRP